MIWLDDDTLEHQDAAEVLTLVDVADMNLDRRLGDAFDRVAQRVAGVAKGARVDDHSVEVERPRVGR